MSDDNTVNSNKKYDGENNGQGTRNVRDGQRHGDDEINLKLNHDSMERYLERQQKMMVDAISKQQYRFLHNLENILVQTIATAVSPLSQ